MPTEDRLSFAASVSGSGMPPTTVWIVRPPDVVAVMELAPAAASWALFTATLPAVHSPCSPFQQM